MQDASRRRRPRKSPKNTFQITSNRRLNNIMER